MSQGGGGSTGFAGRGGAAPLLDELDARGLIHQLTDREGLAAALAAGPVTFYCGYDPSAPSLHCGNLVPLSIMARLARAGHKMIALVGGATGMIGDPSGKSEERKLLGLDVLEANKAAMRGQIQRLVAADAAQVDNHDWLGRFGFLEFLRDVGKHVTVNYMLAKDSVSARLNDREQGISYTEFTYMLLQGYDFAHLARTQGCTLQIGGSDQWGNITCGIELSRRLGNPTQVFGLTAPLLLTSSGKKFGKSEEGAVWLDAARTSPYRFYQFWLNTEDADVARYLKMFTFAPLEEIEATMTAHDVERGRRIAQRRLAEDVTRWVHGPDALARVLKASQVMFGGAIDGLGDEDLEPLLGDVPSSELAAATLDAGLPLVDLLVTTKLADSKGAAKRLLAQGGVYVNNVKQTDEARVVGATDRATPRFVVLRAGKKSYHLIKIT